MDKNKGQGKTKEQEDTESRRYDKRVEHEIKKIKRSFKGIKENTKK